MYIYIVFTIHSSICHSRLDTKWIDKRQSEVCNVLYSSALGVAPQLLEISIGMESNHCLHILLNPYAAGG